MMYMYHSFLIHSSADGHLGCFHVLAMINSAALILITFVFMTHDEKHDCQLTFMIYSFNHWNKIDKLFFSSRKPKTFTVGILWLTLVD